MYCALSALSRQATKLVKTPRKSIKPSKIVKLQNCKILGGGGDFRWGGEIPGPPPLYETLDSVASNQSQAHGLISVSNHMHTGLEFSGGSQEGQRKRAIDTCAFHKITSLKVSLLVSGEGVK